jgi:lipopolysaccharide export system ATP-binding protein
MDADGVEPSPALRSAPRLVVDHITVRAGGRAIVREISMTIEPGEILGIFGPSGAGKSTLFRALAGEQAAASGRVILDGADVTRLSLWQRARRGVGYLPQTPSVLWDLTVAENLAVFARLAVRAKDPARTGDHLRGGGDIDSIARDLGLADRLTLTAGSLSGGERRRLELARALCADPRILFCDEPFAAIDPIGTAHVGEHLLALADRGASVVIADHHVAEALRLCRRAALLLEGELCLVAPPAAFREADLVQKHYPVV